MDPASIAYLLVPFTDIEIIDDWHVLGLAAAGSRALRLRDVLVPHHRCVLLSELFAGTAPGELVEVCGARSVYDTDMLATIRRDVLTVLTHNVASRQAAMSAWGRRTLDA